MVAFCILGAAHDRAALGPESMRWRPILDLCAGTRPRIDRLELLVQPELAMLAEIVHRQLHHVAPQTVVNLQMLPFLSPWDLPQVHDALGDFARAYPFQPERENYLLHLTTSTAVQQVGLILLWAERIWPAQLAFAPRNERDEPSGITILDLPAEAGLRAEPQAVNMPSADGLRREALAREERSRPNGLIEPTPPKVELLATRSVRLQRTAERIHHVATQTEAPILIQGPPGSGKTRLARRIVALKQVRSGRCETPLEIACAALPKEEALALLVGRRTDDLNRPQQVTGFLQKANGGTLLLDEIDALPIEAQAALCQVLETGQVKALGALEGEPCRVCIVATTQHDLLRSPEKVRFRSDLAARLAVFAFTLPALAERHDDVALWLEQWEPSQVPLWGDEVRSRALPSMTAPARERFLAWLGSRQTPFKNGFRDLEATWIRLATYAQEGEIQSEDVEKELAHLARNQSARPEQEDASDEWAGLAQVLGRKAVEGLDRFDRVQLEDVLRVCAESSSLSEAGRSLFAASRSRKKSQNDADRLRKYLARFGLTFPDVQDRLARENVESEFPFPVDHGR